MGWKPTRRHTSCDAEHPVREMPSRLFVVWYKNTRRVKKGKKTLEMFGTVFSKCVWFVRRSTENARASSISTKWDSTEFFPRRDKYDITFYNNITAAVALFTAYKTQVKCLHHYDYYINDKGVNLYIFVRLKLIKYLNIKK